MAAWLHRCRSLALPAGGEREDAARNAGLAILTVAVEHPASVPEALRTIAGRAAVARAAELLHRAQRSADPAVLDEAIATGRVGLDWAPGPRRGTALINLGAALSIRFERAGQIEDIDEAVELNRRALQETTDPTLEPGRLNNLAASLRARFDVAGDTADLDEVVIALHRAVENGRSDRLGVIETNLGLALLARFELSGDPGDLQAWLEAARAAVEHTPANDDEYAMRLSNLGMAQRAMFDHTDDVRHLQDAVASHRRAFDTTRKTHPSGIGIAVNLGNALRTRFEWLGDADDLDEAITVSEQALELLPSRHPGSSRYLANLGDRRTWTRRSLSVATRS